MTGLALDRSGPPIPSQCWLPLHTNGTLRRNPERTPLMAIAVGTSLDRYEILSLLGKGGMGEVYRARDPRLSREVAIKVLPSGLTTDAERLRRFQQEARAAGMLNHPNILVVYDLGMSDGSPYIVSE